MNPAQRLEKPPPRLLIIDDERVLLIGYARALSKHFRVETASSARQALEMLARGEQFDVVLCDLGLQDMDGADLHRHLTEAKNALADRILFCSGGAMTHKTSDFISRMPGRVIFKPLPVPELRSRVRDFAETMDA